MSQYKRGPGFTLIELMIVVAVVAVLAAVALPFYRAQVQKGRRADAMNALEDLGLAQAGFRANCPHYAQLHESDPANVTCASTPGASKVHGQTTSPEGYYQVAIVAGSASATAYEATAAPIAGTSQENDDCGTFAIDQDGPDTSGSYADETCWRR
jgi:type IV pilus assembly protein PilE